MAGWLQIDAAGSPLGIPWHWVVFPDTEHRLVTQHLYSLAVAACLTQASGVIAPVVALGLLGSRMAFEPDNRRVRSWLAAVVLGAVIAGATWFTPEYPPHQADAYRADVRSHDVADLDVHPAIYPVPAHLGILVDRLRAAGRWPATLDPTTAARPPLLSRAARHVTVPGLLLAFSGLILAAAAAWAPTRSGVAAPAPPQLAH